MEVVSYHYDPNRKLILIPAHIKGPYAALNLELVFDPGAYRTIISTPRIEAIGYKATPQSERVSTSSAIGREYGYTVKVDNLQILNFTFNQFEVACFDLPPEYGIDGLLGLDILDYFEITLLHRNSLIQFRRLGTPKIA